MASAPLVFCSVLVPWMARMTSCTVLTSSDPTSTVSDPSMLPSVLYRKQLADSGAPLTLSIRSAVRSLNVPAVPLPSTTNGRNAADDSSPALHA